MKAETAIFVLGAGALIYFLSRKQETDAEKAIAAQQKYYENQIKAGTVKP